MNLPSFDFEAHLARQAAFSARTFGPGARTEGICDHIRKELLEVAVAPGDLKEWIDVAILALDGAWRSGATPGQIIGALVAKQSKNEGRAWPDWRTADPTKAIEHDRSGESKQAVANGEPQPLIGQLMDQISALPVLWGLNEPGALLRNSDVFRVLVAAGRQQAVLAATQVQAQEPVGDATQAAIDVLAERRRQIEVKGWTIAQDDDYRAGQLAQAAASYCLYQTASAPGCWPWNRDYWKPKGYRANMVRAGALILAEIERMDRAAAVEAVKS